MTECELFVESANVNKQMCSYFAHSSGCNSLLGRAGGQQTINLGPNCDNAAIVVHELMHSLGFMHEQSRTGRNGFVDILLDNVQRWAQPNFYERSTDNMGLPYDYGSVMHYRATVTIS